LLVIFVSDWQNTKVVVVVVVVVVQAGLILCDFFLCDFTLMWLENSHHSLHLCDNFWFEVIWHKRSLATLVLCWRPAESDVPVTPVTSHWWYNHGGWCSFPFQWHWLLAKKNDICKSTLFCAIQMKSQQKTISIEDKLDVISQLEKW
jgi:hypothetical protein